MQDKLLSLVLVLLPLSFISERIANFIKLFLPSKGWYSPGNLKTKEPDEFLEKIRERKILLISLVAGVLVACSMHASIFDILSGEDSGNWTWWNESDAIGKSILGCLLTGFFLSWGSKFWHDMLDIVFYAKEKRRTLAEWQKNAANTGGSHMGGLPQMPSLETPPPVVPVVSNPPAPVVIKPEEKKYNLKPDKVSLRRIEKMHPKLKEEAKKIYEEILEANVSVRFTDTLRTIAEQNALYEQGRSRPGKIVTKVKGGYSYHNYGLAIDFVLLLDGGRKVSWDRNMDMDEDLKKDWSEVVDIFKSHGWTWGGDWNSFKDYPHFEKSLGFRQSELLAKVKKGEVDANDYVKI